MGGGAANHHDKGDDGIGGGVEVLGGLWMLLISWVALKTGKLSKALNYIGLVIGLAGIITVVPALGELGGMIFGLGQIVWFLWVGIIMLRNSPSVAAENLDALVPQHQTT